MNNQTNRLKPLQVNGRFYNASHPHRHPFLLRSIWMFMTSRMRRLFGREDYSAWYAPEKVIPRSKIPKITWIGHASFLVQIGGMNILLDPIFGSSSVVFNRFMPPGIALDALPPIDAVLLSHNHYDHMDAATMKHIKNVHNSTFFVPHGDAQWFKKRDIPDVREFMWWQSHAIDPAKWVKVTFLPAHHWSGRSLADINRSLWGSWMIECDGYRIYFAGDTAWDVHFEQIKDAFGPIDVALLPIAPCEPKRWMETSHLNAEQAGEAALALEARHMIGMHWGTFGFGLDRFALPVDRIRAWWKDNHNRLVDKKLHVLKIGQSFSEKIPQAQ